MYWEHVAEYLNALAELESVVGVEPAKAGHAGARAPKTEGDSGQEKKGTK